MQEPKEEATKTPRRVAEGGWDKPKSLDIGQLSAMLTQSNRRKDGSITLVSPLDSAHSFILLVPVIVIVQQGSIIVLKLQVALFESRIILLDSTNFTEHRFEGL